MGGTWIDPRPTWALPVAMLDRAEGVAFSRDGRLLAFAQASANRVCIHQREGTTAAFASEPAWVLEGEGSGIGYPHDVDFSPDGRLLVVANRTTSSATFYARARGEPVGFGRAPVAEIRGKRSRLLHPDGVKFVPPDGEFVAVADLWRSAISFYRRRLFARSSFAQRPAFVLAGPLARIVGPDGLAFTDDGAFLAVTNHGANGVTVYARDRRAPRYGPAPVAELRGGPSGFRYPHSASFSRGGTHLAVSDAGARNVAVYRRKEGAGPEAAWADPPVLDLEACDAAGFAALNAVEPMEGGPKGVAFGPDCFAVCSPVLGVRLHAAAGV